MGPVVPAGRSLDRTSLQEAILTPLVNQFAALQGQMVAQFQQSILMMVDRFREMHQSPMLFSQSSIRLPV